MQQSHVEAARVALKHARAANYDMRNANNVESFYRHWSSFLTEFNTVYNQLHGGVRDGGSASERAWNDGIKCKRYTDPVLKYLSIARQVKDKTVTMTVGLIPPMFAGLSLVSLNSQVPMARFGASSGWHLTPLPVSSGGRSAAPPERHDNKDLRTEWNCASWWDVLDIAMNSLGKVVDEAEFRFVR